MSNAQVVYNLLSTQRFVNWYESKYIPHIEGDETALTREQLVEWLDEELRKIRLDK